MRLKTLQKVRSLIIIFIFKLESNEEKTNNVHTITLLIGQLGEEAQEGRNKDIGNAFLGVCSIKKMGLNS